MRLYLIIRYTLLLLLVSILAGIVLGVIGRLMGSNASDHVWGRFDSELIVRFIGTVIVCFAVYLRLWRKHRDRYFANGAIVAALTGVLGVVCSLLLAPKSVAVFGFLSVAVSVLTHVAIFGFASLLFRATDRARTASTG